MFYHEQVDLDKLGRQIKREGLKSIEKYFDMNFKDVILKLHWEQKKSIKKLSDLCNISRDCFQSNAKRLGLPIRNRKQATSLTNKKGENHWAFGKNKKNSEIHRRHSERMKANNPSHNSKYLFKNMQKMAFNLRKNPLPQEKLFKDMLDNLNVKYVFQFQISKYIIDFFIPDIRLCIEIDSKDKWCKEKKERANTKDKHLYDLGFKVLRIPRNTLKKTDVILNILKTNNVIT
jgi:very-short-patch-repair endonuclease